VPPDTRVLVGDGGGGLRPTLFAAPSTQELSSEAAAADLDGDGLPELLYATGTLEVLRNLPPYPVR
jgi:hypothetical protein